MERLEMETTDDSNAAGDERAMSEWARRLLAGAWFALAAAVPVAYLVLSNPFGEGFSGFYDSMILTAGVPMFVAGVCGLGLGADILNQEETKNALQAAGCGLLVALLSYVVLFIGATLVLAVIGSEDVMGIVAVSVFFFLYGLLFLGWLIALVGAAAGGLLYFYANQR